MNLSEILGSLKRGWKGEKGYGTPPDSCTTHNGTPGWWATVWCVSTNFQLQTLIFNPHQIFKISYFHKFYLSYEKNYSTRNIPKNHQIIYKTMTLLNVYILVAVPLDLLPTGKWDFTHGKSVFCMWPLFPQWNCPWEITMDTSKGTKELPMTFPEPSRRV